MKVIQSERAPDPALVSVSGFIPLLLMSLYFSLFCRQKIKLFQSDEPGSRNYMI